MSHVTLECVVLHIWIYHITRTKLQFANMNASYICHVYWWFTSHTWASHGTRMNKLRDPHKHRIANIWITHAYAPHRNASRHTYGHVISDIRIRTTCTCVLLHCNTLHNTLRHTHSFSLNHTQKHTQTHAYTHIPGEKLTCVHTYTWRKTRDFIIGPFKSRGKKR